MKKSLFVIALLFFFGSAAAQLTVSNDTTICAGQPVQLSVSGGTTYTWSPSGTLSTSTSANPIAMPFQTTTYIVSSPLSNANLVTNGDFSQGNVGFTSSYTYQLPPNTAGTGVYWVGPSPSTFSGVLVNCPDHTGGNGNMIIADAISTPNTPVWCQTLRVVPNADYTLRGWVQALNQTNLPKGRWMVNGTPIGSTANTFLSCIWTSFTATWNAGNDTIATFCVFNPDTAWNGNDFAMDDFSIVASGTQYDTVTITVITPPYVNLGSDTSLCGGSGTILLNAQNPGSSYLWNDGSTQQVLSATSSGTYSVTVTNAGLCSASSSVNISSSSVGNVTIASSNTQICANDSTEICVQSPNQFTSFTWNTQQTSACIQAKFAGNYYVTVTDQNGCTAESNRVSVSVYSTPAVSLSVNGDTLSSYNAAGYQWFLNNSPIPNATSNIYVAQESGNYFVQITDSNGCKATSTTVSVLTSGIDDLIDETISVYPNPNSVGSWRLEVSEQLVGSFLEVTDNVGRTIFKSEIRNRKSEISLEIPLGIYLLQIISGEKIYNNKLIKL